MLCRAGLPFGVNASRRRTSIPASTPRPSPLPRRGGVVAGDGRDGVPAPAMCRLRGGRSGDDASCRRRSCSVPEPDTAARLPACPPATCLCVCPAAAAGGLSSDGRDLSAGPLLSPGPPDDDLAPLSPCCNCHVDRSLFAAVLALARRGCAAHRRTSTRPSVASPADALQPAMAPQDVLPHKSHDCATTTWSQLAAFGAGHRTRPSHSASVSSSGSTDRGSATSSSVAAMPLTSKQWHCCATAAAKTASIAATAANCGPTGKEATQGRWHGSHAPTQRHQTCQHCHCSHRRPQLFRRRSRTAGAAHSPPQGRLREAKDSNMADMHTQGIRPPPCAASDGPPYSPDCPRGAQPAALQPFASAVRPSASGVAPPAPRAGADRGHPG